MKNKTKNTIYIVFFTICLLFYTIY